MIDPILTVVICTYNRARFLPLGLDSWLQQDAEKARFEILVINNNSTDNTAFICGQYIMDHPHFPIRYFEESKQGLSFARNRGIEAAKGCYICFVDDDAMPEKNYLSSLISWLSHHPDVAGVGGQIFPFFIEGKPEWMTSFLEPLVSRFDEGEIVKELVGRRFPVGCNMTYRADYLRRAGGFNTMLGRIGTSGDAGEEKDIFLKIKQLGGRVFYLPGIGVRHIIEAERLSVSYISKLATGLGRSERIRTAKAGVWIYVIKYVELWLKWLAAILLAGYYYSKGEAVKGRALIKFRNDVFKGWHGST